MLPTTHALSTPTLPEELWLAVLGQLDFLTLRRRVRGLSRAFRALVDGHPALDALAFRLPFDPDRLAAHVARGTVVLHPLLEQIGWASDAAGSAVRFTRPEFRPPVVRWGAEGGWVDQAQFPNVPFRDDRGTAPAVRSLTFAYYVADEPALRVLHTLEDADGVRVGAGLDAWLEVYDAGPTPRTSRRPASFASTRGASGKARSSASTSTRCGLRSCPPLSASSPLASDRPRGFLADPLSAVTFSPQPVAAVYSPDSEADADEDDGDEAEGPEPASSPMVRALPGPPCADVLAIGPSPCPTLVPSLQPLT